MQKKGSSHFARMTEMVALASNNAKPPEERAGNEVVVENVISIDPAKCRMNDYHRRLKSSVESAVLDDLVEQFKSVGQVLPARGWRLEKPDADGVEVILIFGARRRAAAEKAQVPLRVEIVPEPTRKALIRQMHSENSSRQDYLPLEQGLEFKAFLESGEAKSKDELSEMLGVNRTRVIRCIQIAELPKEVLSAYSDPGQLGLIHGTTMASLIETELGAKKRLIDAAIEWKAKGKTGNPTSFLLKAAKGERGTAKMEHVLLSPKKVKLGTLTASPSGAISVDLKKNAPQELREAILELLKKHFPELPE